VRCGTPARGSLVRHSPNPPPLVVRIGVNALRGLHDAHALQSAQGRPLGLVHRYVSPDNLFITRGGVQDLR
jgi:eukaryotic-like serine/threonine-protein kinase